MSGGPPPAPAADDQAAVTDKWVLPLIVLTVGQFMAVLDMTIVNVATPTLATEFGVATDKIEWVVTAYSLVLGVVAPASGWLSDRIGPTRLFTISLVGFAIASALCAMSWDLPSMVVFRVMQAVPGGVIPALTMLIIYRIVPPEKLGTAMGIFGVGVMVGPSLGPTLGGYLVEHTTWQWIFLINVPIGLIGAVVCVTRLPKLTGKTDRTFDLLGFITAGGGLCLLLLVLHEGKEWGWTSYPTLILVTVSAFSLAVFVVIQLEKDEPLIDLRVLKTFPYTMSLLLVVIMMTGMQAMMFFLTIFMQQIRGMNAFDAGLMMFPQMLVVMVFMPISGRIYDLLGPRLPAIFGLVVSAWACWELAALTPSTTNSQLVLWTCVRGFGSALAMMPIITAGLAAIPTQYATAGSQLNSIGQEMAGSLGLAALTVVADQTHAQLMADRGAAVSHTAANPDDPAMLYGLYQQLNASVTATSYGNIFVIAAVLSGAGVLLALFLAGAPKNPATSTAPLETAADSSATQTLTSAPVDAPPTREQAAGRYG